MMQTMTFDLDDDFELLAIEASTQEDSSSTLTGKLLELEALLERCDREQEATLKTYKAELADGDLTRQLVAIQRQHRLDGYRQGLKLAYAHLLELTGEDVIIPDSTIPFANNDGDAERTMRSFISQIQRIITDRLENPQTNN